MQQVVNTEVMGVPNLMNDGKGATCLAVLTRDHIGKFAVYTGIVPLPWSNELSNIEWHDMKLAAAQVVMRQGQKLPHRAAIAYFPSIPENLYRD